MCRSQHRADRDIRPTRAAVAIARVHARRHHHRRRRGLRRVDTVDARLQRRGDQRGRQTALGGGEVGIDEHVGLRRRHHRRLASSELIARHDAHLQPIGGRVEAREVGAADAAVATDGGAPAAPCHLDEAGRAACCVLAPVDDRHAAAPCATARARADDGGGHRGESGLRDGGWQRRGRRWRRLERRGHRRRHEHRRVEADRLLLHAEIGGELRAQLRRVVLVESVAHVGGVSVGHVGAAHLDGRTGDLIAVGVVVELDDDVARVALLGRE